MAEYRVLGIEDGIERWALTAGRQPVGFIGAIREITEEACRGASGRERRHVQARSVDLVRLGRYWKQT